MFTNSWWLSSSCCQKVDKDSLVYEGVVNDMDLGIVGYIGPIDAFLTFCPGPIKGLENDPRWGILAIMMLTYNGF